jgi:hypothetical protein
MEAKPFSPPIADATHTGMWSHRFGPGVHNVQVQFWTLQGAPAEVLNA